MKQWEKSRRCRNSSWIGMLCDQGRPLKRTKDGSGGAMYLRLCWVLWLCFVFCWFGFSERALLPFLFLLSLPLSTGTLATTYYHLWDVGRDGSIWISGTKAVLLTRPATSREQYLHAPLSTYQRYLWLSPSFRLYGYVP